MPRWFRPVNRDQGCLFPDDIRSWLPPGHLAWQILGVTGELDLSGFAAAYRADGQGQAPYDPAMMVALVLYCYFKGIRSSRKIREACTGDVGARVICGGAAPSHQAVAQFLRRHRAEVRRLFVQVLGLLAAAGAVQGHCAAIDGSPVSGNASRFANLDAAQLQARIDALQAAVGAAADAWLDGADQADRAGSQQPLPYDDDDDGGGPGGGMPRRLAAMAAKLARLSAAQDKLTARQAAPASPDARVTAARQALGKVEQRLARAEQAQAAVMARYHAAVAAGKPWRAGRKPVPAEKNAKIARIRKNLATARDRLAAAQARAAATAPARVSATDPDCRVLPAKNGGGYLQGWNLELAAARRQVLLAIELHDNPADCGALIPMIQAAAASCEQAGIRGQIRAWLADNGYASAANFAALEHLMLLVAVTGEASQAGRAGDGGAPPAGWQKMAARLATPPGQKLYKRRAGRVEPAFAQLFARFGRYVNYRGRDAVDAEIKLLGAVHNLAKLLSHRHRHPAPA